MHSVVGFICGPLCSIFKIIRHTKLRFWSGNDRSTHSVSELKGCAEELGIDDNEVLRDSQPAMFHQYTNIAMSLLWFMGEDYSLVVNGRDTRLGRN